jgi:hypothetical protein
MCTNTEEFDISFGGNILKNESGDQAEWQMMSFHVWISTRNSNIKYNQNKEIQQCVYIFKFGVKFKIPEQFEVRESLLSFGVESFIFQFAIQKQRSRILILLLVLYGCKVWFVTFKEEHRLRVFKRC